MEKVKAFCTKYKSQILLALGAVSSIAASLALMPNANGVLYSIIIAVVAVLVEVLSNGMTEQAITLIAKAIQIIIEEVNKNSTVTNTEVVAASAPEVIPTLEEIKKRLKA